MIIEPEIAIPVAVAIAKGVDYLVEYVKKRIKGEDETPKNVDKLLHRIDELEKVLLKTDADGIPLCYTPRRLVNAADEQKDLVKGLVHSNENIAKVMEKLGDAIDGMVRLLDKIELRTQRLEH